MIAGFIVNRFRGDPSLFADGMRLIAERTGWAALGLVPHFPDAARLPAEDVLGLAGSGPRGPGSVTVAVPVLPRIANFDDLDPLRAEPGRVGGAGAARHADPRGRRPGAAAGLQDHHRRPGGLPAEGWDIDLRAHVRRGGRVLGLCGGYQMLGRSLADPHGIEGAPRTVPGLGLLDVETVMTPDKRLAAVTGTSLPDARAVLGLRDAYRRDRGPRRGPAAAAPRRRAHRRGGLGGRARGRDLRARAVRPRCPAGGLARAPRDGLGGRRATRPGSRRRSTGWRDTSRPMSIATACWRLPGSRGPGQGLLCVMPALATKGRTAQRNARCPPRNPRPGKISPRAPSAP